MNIRVLCAIINNFNILRFFRYLDFIIELKLIFIIKNRLMIKVVIIENAFFVKLSFNDIKIFLILNC